MGAEQQTESEAVDQLFADPSPGTESQGTSAEEQATAGTEQTAEGQQTEGQTTQEQAAEIFAEVAGRKYSTKEDFIKSHENVLGLLKKAQAYEQESKTWKATHDKWGPWDKWLNENPVFYKQLQAAEQKYRELRQRGLNDQTARAISGTQSVPPQVLKQLQDQQAYIDRQQQKEASADLDVEINAVAAKYKLDPGMRKAVMGVMFDVIKATGLDISAEEAYYRLRDGQNRTALAKKDVELQRVKAGDGPVTTTGARAPKKPLAQMSDKEFNAELLDQVNRMNLTD